MRKIMLVCRRILLVFAVIIGILLLWFFVRTIVPMAYNPMRRTAPMIRNHILRRTPIGMYIEDVMIIIENNESWGSPSMNRNSGFIIQGDGFPHFPLFAVVGERSIQTHTVYNTILWHDRIIRIFWGFDKHGNLVEVFVISALTPRPVHGHGPI